MATRLREKERALAAAEVAATRPGDPPPPDHKREREREPSASGDIAGRAGSLGGRAARGWSRDDDDAWNPEDASLFPRARTKTTKRARRGRDFANLTNLSVSATRRDAVAMERFASRGAREGRSVALRPRVETDPDSGSVRVASFGVVVERRAPRTRGKIFWTTSSRKSTRRRTRRRARTTRPPPPLTRTARPRPPLDRLRFVCRPGRRRSRGAASEAASGTTRARVRIPRGTRATGKSLSTAQTVAAVAQRWFDRAGRASSRGVPLCDARDDARRAERTRVD